MSNEKQRRALLNYASSASHFSTGLQQDYAKQYVEFVLEGETGNAPMGNGMLGKGQAKSIRVQIHRIVEGHRE